MIPTLRRVLPDWSWPWTAPEWTPSPLEWLDEEELFDVLANDRRRHAIILLSEAGGPTHLDDLAVEIAATEYDKHPDLLSAKERKRVRNTLYQNHLPKLERYTLVSVDGRNVVTPIRDIEDIARYAELGVALAGGSRRPGRSILPLTTRTTLALLLAGLALLLVLAVSLGVVP